VVTRSLIFGKRKVRSLNGEDNMSAGKTELMPPSSAPARHITYYKKSNPSKYSNCTMEVRIIELDTPISSLKSIN
jgi:hypothetical protein